MLDSTQIGDFEFRNLTYYSGNLIYQNPIVLSSSSDDPISQKCWISRAYFRGRLLEGNRSVRGVTCGERVTETCYTRHLTPGRQSLCVQYVFMCVWVCVSGFLCCGYKCVVTCYTQHLAHDYICACALQHTTSNICKWPGLMLCGICTALKFDLPAIIDHTQSSVLYSTHEWFG